jgi:predicted alpha/beta-hydrolase family hydrolase
MTAGFSITVDADHRVSARLDAAADAHTCFVFAHGAGAGMDHGFMTAVAEGLAQRRVATLRYQFPYMERGSRRPDRPALCHATVRAAVAEAARQLPGLPLIAGGKSFGGRMTSQAQAIEALPRVVGLAFLGFPLHPAGKPSSSRGEHLRDVDVPMLFIQGERDTLAERALIEPLVRSLGRHASLEWIDAADHSFHVLKRSGRTDHEALDEVITVLVGWTDTLTIHRR